MLRKDEKFLEVAAEETMRRIRKDRKEKATARIRPLVVHIEDHLFDPQLSVKTLMKDCEVRDHSVSVLFNRDLHEPPATYIRQRRLETAARLLVDTDLRVWKIAHLAGFSGPGVFGESFKEWAGLTPTAYRKAARKAVAESESHGRRLQEIGRRFIEGQAYELDLEELDFLDLWVDAQKQARVGLPPKNLAFDGTAMERGLALTHWERLRHLPPREQQEIVRQPYGLTTTVLFDVLREKSREEGRKDRQEGVRIAELALVSLDGIAAHLTAEELANRKAQGTAWLGNALRLALDFPKAERMFNMARELLPDNPDLEVLGGICDLEGELFLFQSRFKEALELKDRAVELFASLDKKERLAESLISRATAIGHSQGYASSIPDLLRALGLLEEASPSYLSLAVQQNLVLVYALCGEHSEASRRLPATRSLCESVGDPLILGQLQWTEGFLKYAQGDLETAESLTLNAHRGFTLLGEVGYAAAVDLDLAEISLEMRRPSKAIMYALRAIPVFESFSIHSEALAALAILGEVAVEQKVRIETLREIRGYLQHLLQSPLSYYK